ncbi:MAG: hypothetical protein WCR61_03775 [Bacteroidales bacterium]|nr:hypothetical protein [Bacteroidales bacterium]MDD4655987.1 hypothetical protein [Bacteroidales bacterium]
MQLPHNLKSGLYTIRGYTQWMQNYSNDYMFHKQVFIINPLEKEIGTYKTEHNGMGWFKFYSSDRFTRLNINVQGVTQDGRYFILE